MHFVVAPIVIVLVVLLVFMLMTGRNGCHTRSVTLRPAAGVTTNATGKFELVPTGEATKFSYSLVVDRMTDVTAAHIHYSSNASVAYPLPQVLPSAGTLPSRIYNGTVTFRPEDLGLLGNGGLYVNVHTARYPNGELEGTL